jgi:methionyl-tRNA formyltransferase
MRVIYFGSGAFGVPTLEALTAVHDVMLVVSQPDRPSGRRRLMTPTPAASCADRRGLPTFKPDDPNDPDAIERIHTLQPEAFVVIAYGHKLGPALLDDLFAINLHASLLPKYRGAAPINWAMINGETETGISVITLAQRMDAGGVLGQRKTCIDPIETAGELHDRLAEMGPDLVLDTMQHHCDGTLQPTPQDHSKATRAPKLTKADGTTSFDQPARDVRGRIHGMTPWPGCTVNLDGEPIKLLRVREQQRRPSSALPGEVQPDRTVACSTGSLELLAVQPAGGKSMSFDAYCNGRNIKPGIRIEPL